MAPRRTARRARHLSQRRAKGRLRLLAAGTSGQQARKAGGGTVGPVPRGQGCASGDGAGYSRGGNPGTGRGGPQLGRFATRCPLLAGVCVQLPVPPGRAKSSQEEKKTPRPTLPLNQPSKRATGHKSRAHACLPLHQPLHKLPSSSSRASTRPRYGLAFLVFQPSQNNNRQNEQNSIDKKANLAKSLITLEFLLL